MILYHGSREIVEYPEIRKAQYHKDFYFVQNFRIRQNVGQVVMA